MRALGVPFCFGLMPIVNYVYAVTEIGETVKQMMKMRQ